MKIYDMHIHVGAGDVDQSYLLEQMEKAGVFGGGIISEYPDTDKGVAKGVPYKERLQFRLEKVLRGVPSGEYGIETHIQQGAPLKTQDCLASFDMAREFFRKHFPEYSPEYFMCDSWLLNPNLEKIAPDSNIARFMRLWEKIDFPDDKGAQAVERIFGFGVELADVKELEPKTSLQKNAKEFLLSGGDLRMTAGYIKI